MKSMIKCAKTRIKHRVIFVFSLQLLPVTLILKLTQNQLIKIYMIMKSLIQKLIFFKISI